MVCLDFSICLLRCQAVQFVYLGLVLEDAGYLVSVEGTYRVTVLRGGVVVPIITVGYIAGVEDVIAYVDRLVLQGRTVQGGAEVPVANRLGVVDGELKS